MADFTIGLSDDTFDGDSEGVVSGDRVYITGGAVRNDLTLSNVHGASGNPVTIINAGGIVQIDANRTSSWVALELEECEHVKVSGRGHARKYGIKLYNYTNSGLLAWKGTRYAEFENIEMAEGLSGDARHTGLWIGTMVSYTDPFTTFDINIHDCYCHDIASEAMYINHGDAQSEPEQVIDDLDVNYNVMHDCGYDGIQVRKSTDISVRRNEAWNMGAATSGTTQAGAGVVVGAQTTDMEVWYNWIYDSHRGVALVSPDSGANVHHNLIENMDDLSTKNGTGIYVPGDGAGALIEHNTVLDCETYGLRAGETDGIMKNNVVAGCGTNISTNFSEFSNTTGTIAAMNFVTDDVMRHLTAASPAVGAADDGKDNGWLDYN